MQRKIIDALIDVLVAVAVPWRLGKRLSGRTIEIRWYGLPSWCGLLFIPAAILGGQICSAFGAPRLPAPQAGLMAAMSEGIIDSGPQLSLEGIAVGIPALIILSLGSGLAVAFALFGLAKLTSAVFEKNRPEAPDHWAFASRACSLAPLCLMAVGLAYHSAYSRFEVPRVFIACVSAWIICWFWALGYGWFRAARGQPRGRALAMGSLIGVLGPGAIILVVVLMRLAAALVFKLLVPGTDPIDSSYWS